MLNFAITGAAGYIAPRHLRAIRDTGNRLVAAVDPHDAVGVLDRFAQDARFFTEIERFDRHLEKLRRGPADARVHYVSICSPNYLHDAHIRLALRLGAHAICEKPVVINPWNVDALRELEQETGGRVNTVLQLRLHPSLIALKKTLDDERSSGKHEVDLTYITGRGPWYGVSWKGSMERSGGIATNIGIHFFDMLLWLFGEVEASEVYMRQPRKEAGYLECARARVRWFLSTDFDDLPSAAAGETTFRSITIDGQELDFTEGFTDLHTRVYEEVLAGRGFGLEDARPSITLAQRIRESVVTTPGPRDAHPKLSVGV
jgi:UDP-N-acetyl-2-amino-2-deoxyglucuronate dehydrogenase